MPPSGGSGVDFNGMEKERQALKDFLGSEKASSLKDAFKRLMTGSAWLSSQTFHNSNAAGKVGWCFKQAFCESEASGESIYFGSCFLTGLQLLGNYVLRQELPAATDAVQRLHFLVDFLTNDENQRIIQNYVSKNDTDSSVCVVLANHLLSKLCSHEEYYINHHYQTQKGRCPCDCDMDIRHRFSNTCIGNEEVWHGPLDVALSGSSVHFQPKSCEAPSDVEEERTNSELLSQCIVFSFFQKQKHPDFKNKLIPSIGVIGRNVLVYMYDAESDVFLTSSPLSLVLPGGESLDILTLLCLWLVLNSQTLGTGLPSCAPPVAKANFFDIAAPKLEVYQTKLKFGISLGGVKRKSSCAGRGLGDLRVDDLYKRLKQEYGL